MDFSKVKFRASSFGNLMSEPVSKADKEAGKLSLTCQKELIKIYNRIVYNWEEPDITTIAMQKGTIGQTESVMMYSRLEGKMFIENSEHLENDFFIGTPDLYLGEDIRNAIQVDDIKNSFSLKTFSHKIVEPLDNAYKAQLNVYYDLCNCDGGNIVHTLISLPQELFKQECDKLLWKMANKGEIATEYAPEYLDAVEELKKQYFYDHIPETDRVYKQFVAKDDELIEKMKAKVPILRQWLAEFHQKRTSFYQKT